MTTPPRRRKGGEFVIRSASDADRAVDFFAKVLSFEKVSDIEVTGRQYEHLQGIFGLRMRVVRMKLGDELIELTQYPAPEGRPLTADRRGHDRWFQQAAIKAFYAPETLIRLSRRRYLDGQPVWLRKSVSGARPRRSRPAMDRETGQRTI